MFPADSLGISFCFVIPYNSQHLNLKLGSTAPASEMLKSVTFQSILVRVTCILRQL